VAVEPQVLELAASDFAFSTDTLHAVAGRPIVIHFVNEERNLDHNLTLWTDESRTEQLFHGQLVDGGEEIDYELGSLEAGEYYFECFPHLDIMNGHLVVEAE
jgi:plastocyanin